MGTTRREPRIFGVQRNSHNIENRQKRVPLPLFEIRRFLRRLNRELRLASGAAFVVFMTDGQMKRLNTKFRKKAKTTDVLSFPSESRNKPRTLTRRTMEVRGAFLGDVAISPIVARRNAAVFGRTMAEEICVLMLHGVLHLLGYDHETDRGEMDRVETKLRRRLGLS
jgi:probable rRNA maturation factor